MSLGRKHIWLPDPQCRPSDTFEHLEAAGNYIVDKRPDVIVNLGDHFDFPSLSTYDKGRKRAEGQRVNLDIAAGREGMAALLGPLKRLQATQKRDKKKIYIPEMHFLFGNHEDRLTRHVEAHPELEGFLSLDDLGLEAMGWTVHEFLKPVCIDGVWFAHYFYNPANGRPYAGMMQTIIKNIGHSFVQGHRQGLDTGIKYLSTGETRRGVIAGSFYQHNEHYRGPQATNEWRGIIFATEVKEGSFNICEVSLPYLLDRWLT